MRAFVALWTCAYLAALPNPALASDYTGFISDRSGVEPVARSYRGAVPAMRITGASRKTILVYSHGTTRPQRREDCSKWYNRVPETLSALEDDGDTHIYYLCSRAIDDGDPGSYIFKRADEIERTLDELIDAGVQPRNIFLAGHSAGAWSSLMLMREVGDKFNAAIVFAPACCGPRHEISIYPIWRRKIRPRHVERMIDVREFAALVFAYANDRFNRPRELRFLKEAFPRDVRMVTRSCRAGHASHLKDCRAADTTTLIRGYIRHRKSVFAH